MTLLVTGSAGFIGANFVREWFRHSDEPIVSLDKLTYAGHLESLEGLAKDGRHSLVRGDIGDVTLVGQLLERHQVRAVVNFAAESHVDRSIVGPEAFVQTNVLGFSRLLEATRAYHAAGKGMAARALRFLQVSTDEVFGSLEPNEPAFSEERPYRPNSPYAASKAAADHLLRAYWQTYGLPTLLVRSSNNFGPYQYPEKLIPLVIRNALADRPLPVYGDGRQIRDWLYVSDHCAALRRVLEGGAPGHSYNVGGGNQLANIDLILRLCGLLDELRPRSDGRCYGEQIRFVQDRLGHDRRYALDSGKARRELGWQPAMSLDGALRQTLGWYLANGDWLAKVTGAAYADWLARQYP